MKLNEPICVKGLIEAQSKCSLRYNEGHGTALFPERFIILHFVLGAQLCIILVTCEKCAGFSVSLCGWWNSCSSAFPAVSQPRPASTCH